MLFIFQTTNTQMMRWKKTKEHVGHTKNMGLL